jgi:hypothetical protein
VLLVANRLDLSAEMIGVLYRHRWQIELFFRWLKCMANFKHFFSESANGVTLQVYAAIIGTLLIALETQARPARGWDAAPNNHPSNPHHQLPSVQTTTPLRSKGPEPTAKRICRTELPRGPMLHATH